MDETLVLRISDNDCVDFNGAKLHSVNEIAKALKKVIAENPEIIVSIESTGSGHYESIGKAIYGSHRAGVVSERLHILNDGTPWGT